MKGKDKRPCNEKGELHGYWEVYYNNGRLYYKGNLINGKMVGLWEWYDITGELATKPYYII